MGMHIIVSTAYNVKPVSLIEHVLQAVKTTPDFCRDMLHANRHHSHLDSRESYHDRDSVQGIKQRRHSIRGCHMMLRGGSGAPTKARRHDGFNQRLDEACCFRSGVCQPGPPNRHPTCQCKYAGIYNSHESGREESNISGRPRSA